MNDTLEITTLGGLEISVGGEPVTGFYSRKVEALLVYLACTGRPVSRDVLADLLWDEVTQSRAMGSLRVALHSLREKLGPYVEITRTTVALDAQSDCWLDAAELQANLDAAQEQGSSVTGAVAERLADAVGLYEGDFLSGFFVRDCPRFEEWQLVEQERLRNLVVGALNELVAFHLDQNAYDSALLHARRLLELDPLLEETHRQVMVCLASSGQRSAALAQYEACRQVLDKELGVEPEAETTAVFQQIVAGEIASAATITAPPRHNLPQESTPFVGRETELTDINQLLSDADVRLVTVVGPGGMGKTRLALEAAFAQLGAFEDGIFFVSLAALESVEAIVPTVAEAVGFVFYGSTEPEQQILDYLRGKRMLLVMDNFEHLLDGARFVTEIIRTAPGAKVLATSRARLNVGGEHRYQVTGMQYPDPDTAAQEWNTAQQYSAVKLFVEGARRATPGFELTEDNLSGVVAVCRLVEGMPLAIRLAAGWVDTVDPSAIAQEITHSLDFLETELHDAPARQRSVRAAFNHSWRLLSDREREVFQGLSVFRGGFTRDAAQAVASASLRELKSLVNKSLLQLGASGRYGVHELLRQYGTEQLDTSPDGDAGAHDRHCAYYVAALEQWGAEVKGARQQEALTEIGEDRENANAAWRWAVEYGQVKRLNQAMEAWGRYHSRRGQHRDGEAAFGMAANRLRDIPEAGKTGGFVAATAHDKESLRGAYAQRVLIKVLAWQGWFNWLAFQRAEAARPLLEEALALLDEPLLADVDVRSERAFAFFEAGSIALYAGRERKAKASLEESLKLYRELGDRFMVANLLGFLGVLFLRLNSYDEAREARLESLELRRELGDIFGTGASLLGLMDVAVALGQLEEAEQWGREGLAAFRASGSRYAVAQGTVMLGLTFHWQGKFAAARSHFEESSALFDDLGMGPGWKLTPRLGMCWTDLGLGRYEDAQAQAQACLALAREARRGWKVGQSLAALGALALAAGRFNEARNLFLEGAAVSQESNPQEAPAWFDTWLSFTACWLGQIPGARERLYASLRIITEHRYFLPALWAVPAAALLLAREEQAERAVELYALASRHGYVANSQWFEDVAGEEIAAVAATLPPDVVAAAQERGKARDLWETAEQLLEELTED